MWQEISEEIASEFQQSDFWQSMCEQFRGWRKHKWAELSSERKRQRALRRLSASPKNCWTCKNTLSGEARKFCSIKCGERYHTDLEASRRMAKRVASSRPCVICANQIPAERGIIAKCCGPACIKERRKQMKKARMR